MAITKNRTGLIEAGPIALADADPFPNPKTLREAMLMQANVGENNNKFYSLKLEESSSGEFRTLVNYGRVGASGRFEVRGHSTYRADAEAAYEKMHREKTKKYREVQLVANSAGARSVAVAVTGSSGGMVKGDAAFRSGVRAPAIWSHSAQAFYNEMLREAQCFVETGMQASNVSSAGLQTPLGVVGESDIREALGILGKMPPVIANLALAGKKSMSKRATSKSATTLQEELTDLNSKFFTLVPTPIGSGRVKLADFILDDATKIADKEQLLQSALGLIAAQQPQPSSGTVSYPVLLEDVDAEEGRMLRDLLRKEKCRCHDNARLDWKSAFRVTRPADVAKFRQDLCGKNNEERLLLFHGTRRTTAAGILSRGLLPTRAATAAGGNYSGSAYGDGIYFANNAGKSLGYTGASTGKRIMFVSFVAMGKRHVHNGRATGWSSFRRNVGCDSVHAVGGNDLAHDEMIVPTSEQTALCYVMEV